MKKTWSVALAVLPAAVLAVAVRADHYATKADFLRGKLTPGATESALAGSDGCSSPAPPKITGPLGPFQDGGDTTGAFNTVREIPVACNGLFPVVAGPDHIYEFQVAAGNSLTFTVSTTSASYDPSIYVLGTCGEGTTCVTGAAADDCVANDFGGQPSSCPRASSTESFSFSFAPGTYFLFIDSFYSSVSAPQRAQGPYALTVSGTLPVELLRFEVD